MFGSKLITTPLRKATKVVVYTAIPVAGPLKAATMGTRSGNLNRKEVRKQTALLQQQNALLAQQTRQAQAPSVPSVLSTPDGKWVSYDGGSTYHHPGQAPSTEAAPVAAPAEPAEADIPDQIAKLAALRDQGILTDEEFEAKKAELLARM